MYCRFCYYDLNGLQSPRCPECGTGFGFDDVDSFLSEKPGAFRRAVYRLRRKRVPLIVVLAILLTISYACAYDILPAFGNAAHPRALATRNIKDFMTGCLLHKYKHPEHSEVNAEASKHLIAPNYSPWTQPSRARWRATTIYFFRYGPFYVVPTVACLLMTAALVRRRVRRVVLIPAALLLAILLGSISPRGVAARLFRGNHVYLDDIVLVQGITLGGAVAGQTIAAYDIQSFRRPGPRLIAFADGHAQWLWDERAEPLFQAQGIPYPEVTD